MHLIVAEKNISARRIAEILGEGKKITEHKDAGVSTYTFGDITTVGLRGHVVEIDFEPGYQNWRSEEYTPRSLIDAKTIKVPTEERSSPSSRNWQDRPTVSRLQRTLIRKGN